MSMDHGVLNTPLASRPNTLFGQTRKQFDAQKRAEAAAAKDEARLIRERARHIVDGLSDECLKIVSQKAGLTVKQTTKKLRSEARWNPNAILRMFGDNQ